MKNSLLILILLSSFFSCEDSGVEIIDPPSGYNFTDIQPSWSPNGNKIVYIHQDTSASLAGIYIIDTSGNNKRLLINGYQYSPSWSPNGEWVVFSNADHIYKIKENGDSLTQLTFEGNNFFPTWSNDGQWIAYDSNFDSPNGSGFYYIWKMRSDGSNKVRIGLDTLNGSRQPHWMMNKIVHIRYYDKGEVSIMDTNGLNNTRLINNGMFTETPKLSMDGNTITFTVTIPGPRFQVWTINSNGTNLKNLISTYEQGYSPSWSPDGNSIIYTNSAPDNGKLWIMSKNGTNKKQLNY